MIQFIQIPTFSDERGHLSSIEFSKLPFTPQRIFYTYGSEVNSLRAGHSHKKAIVGLIALSGNYRITCKKNEEVLKVKLEHPNECLIINPRTFHTIESLNENGIMMVIASEAFDPSDIE